MSQKGSAPRSRQGVPTRPTPGIDADAKPLRQAYSQVGFGCGSGVVGIISHRRLACAVVRVGRISMQAEMRMDAAGHALKLGSCPIGRAALYGRECTGDGYAHAAVP